MNSAEPVPVPAPRVLVVEDDPVISHLVSHLLTRDGFAVIHAADGRRALEVLETLAPTAVIVLDVMLPFADGFAIVERARAIPAWARVPIIMLTSKSQESVVIQAFGAGADDYIVKPFRLDEFLARVRRLAGKSAAA